MLLGWMRQNRTGSVEQITRRTRLIMHRNPRHPMADCREVAEDEAMATLALAVADEATRPAAELCLRSIQLRAANLDLTKAEAREAARVQLAGERARNVGSGRR